MSSNVVSLADWARRESAARVRRWRCAAGQTQHEAAAALGVSERQLRACDSRGRVGPS